MRDEPLSAMLDLLGQPAPDTDKLRTLFACYSAPVTNPVLALDLRTDFRDAVGELNDEPMDIVSRSMVASARRSRCELVLMRTVAALRAAAPAHHPVNLAQLCC
jgi:hypothetical protein